MSGNFIGCDISGNALGNDQDGVLISGGSHDNEVNANNVISSNGEYGVEIQGDGADGNGISGNKIGTDPSGSVPLPNGSNALAVRGGAQCNNIGKQGTIFAIPDPVLIGSDANNSQSAPIISKAWLESDLWPSVMVELSVPATVGAVYPLTITFYWQRAGAGVMSGFDKVCHISVGGKTQTVDLGDPGLSAGDLIYAVTTDRAGNSSAFSSGAFLSRP